MNKDLAIKAENVSKKYCRSLKMSMFYGLKDIAVNVLSLSSHPEILRKDEFWALNDISFEVKKGETLGVIGPNGAGKTTLLKLLNGLFWPDKGKISICGKVGALIAVGAGFHPMLTGRENIYLNGAILGMSKQELNKKFDLIVDFADIRDFLDTPVKFYSSGMFVRLGFSVAAYSESDILLVDEVLAVGDIEFQAKCFNRIGALKREGNITTVLVSHNMHKISGFCDKVLYIVEAGTRYIGDVSTAIEAYKEDIRTKGELSNSELDLKKVRGSGFVTIETIEFLDNEGNVLEKMHSGESLIVRIHFLAKGKVDNIELDISIDSDGVKVFQGTNKNYNARLDIFKEKGFFDIHFWKFNLNGPKALFNFALWRKGRTELFDWKREVSLGVKGNPLLSGKILFNIDWSVN